MESSHFALSPRRFLVVALVILVVLNIGNALSLHAIFVRKLDFALGVIPLFNFDRESNLPTLFNGLLLAWSGFLAWVISRTRRPEAPAEARGWCATALVLSFLALDDLCLLHETVGAILDERVETSGALAWAWVVPYGTLALCGFIYFGRFFFMIEGSLRIRLAAAAVLYVGSAIGLEMAEAAVTEKYGYEALAFGILYTIEENGEMLAALLVAVSLMGWLARNQGSATLQFVSSAKAGS